MTPIIHGYITSIRQKLLFLRVTCEHLDLEFDECDLGSEDDEDIANEESTAGTWCVCLDIANIDNNEGVCFEMKLVHWAKQVKHGPKNTVPNLSSFELAGFVGIEHAVRLVMHIAEAAPKLSRVCLDSTTSYGYGECCKHLRGILVCCCCKHWRSASTACARKLAVGFPSAVHVKILS